MAPSAPRAKCEKPPTIEHRVSVCDILEAKRWASLEARERNDENRPRVTARSRSLGNGEELVTTPDRSFEPYCDEMIDSVGLAVYGRRAYELMLSYWPNAEANPRSPADHAFAVKMNALLELVLSRTLTHAAWNNTRILGEASRSREVNPREPIGVHLGAVVFDDGDADVFAAAGALQLQVRTGDALHTGAFRAVLVLHHRRREVGRLDVRDLRVREESPRLRREEDLGAGRCRADARRSR